MDGSAKVKEDYIAVDEILTFEPEEREKQVTVKIVDDKKWEPDEEFFLKLSLFGTYDDDLVKLGRISVMEITILDDDSKLEIFTNDRVCNFTLSFVMIRKIG